VTPEIIIHLKKIIMHTSMNIMTYGGHITLEHYLGIPWVGENPKKLAQSTTGMFHMHKFMK
jgi:hypothetical protein